ncbi:MAG: T9SS type A sorting domain-containing protein [Bacteroidota bacterium]|nr:T9SS type A sorting domain-containing protein [Bacteroidota bacterium]
MRKLLALVIIIISILFLGLTSDNPKRNINYSNINVLDSKKLDGNNISAWFRNNGSFHRDPVTGNSGFEWPLGSSKYLTYASGLWLIAKVASDTLAAIAEYDYEYLPGFINSNGIPQGKDDSNYRVYKIIKGDTTSSDYLNWPVSQGAYFDSLNKPFLPGTQTMFYSMTDGYPEAHTNHAGSTAPMKAQVQVTNWCYNSIADPVFSNVIISEFKIINKNSLAWNDGIISIWSDAHSSEPVALGCDTNLNLGYAYCKPNTFFYGSTPPSFGFLLLQGPLKYTGNPNDIVYSFIPGKSERVVKIGYKEIKLASFNVTINGLIPGDPNNYRETYLYMQGIQTNGNPWTLPGTSTITKFPYSGDPESGSGWVQYPSLGFGNRRYIMNFGFINFNPGDTQTILVAQIVSQGINNLNSVTVLKQNSQYIKNVFDQNFTTVSVNESRQAELPAGFKLFQNYPNPFNPNTVISYQLTVNSYVKLKVYDVLGNLLETLINKKQSAGNYDVSFSGRNLSSGIYFYELTTGNYSEAKRMIFLK